MNESRLTGVDRAELTRKHARLVAILRECGSAVVAFSGGVASTYLARSAFDVLGARAVLAVTGRDEFDPADISAAAGVAHRFGIPHLELRIAAAWHGNGDDDATREAVPRADSRTADFWSQLIAFAGVRGYRTVLDGRTAGNVEARSGAILRSRELGVRSPLLEAELTAAGVRILAGRVGLLAADPRSGGDREGTADPGSEPGPGPDRGPPS